MDADPETENPEIKETTFQIVGTVSNSTEEKCEYTEEEYSVNITTMYYKY